MIGRRSVNDKLQRGVAATIAAALLVSPGLSSAQKQAPPKTIGLVLTGFWYALHESPNGKTECPAGMNAETLAQFRAQFPTPQAQAAQFVQAQDVQARAANGANTTYNPDLAGPEPVPPRYVETSIGVGLDLDGSASDAGSASTCAHANFTSPEGQGGIDNQMYRVIGCVGGFRSSGFHAGIVQQNIKEHVGNRTLVEITGVDDERNDPQVEVAIYKGKDPLIEDSAGKVTPFQTQRIDQGLSHAVQRAKGKIVDGVLITDPIELELPFFMVSARGSVQLHDMRMRLQLGDVQASGLIGGYSDIERWYNFFTRSIATSDFLGAVSGPTIYQGLRRFADGRKDPRTGQCQAISTAYSVKFTRVFVAR